MDITTKLAYAKQHITSIATHDEAPEKEVYGALNELAREIDRQRSGMAKRRAKGAAEAAKKKEV